MGQPIETKIKEIAAAYGFDACAITQPERIVDAGAQLTEFIRLGRHGEMTWMAQTAARRASPTTLWSECRSIIMLGMNYAPSDDTIHDPLARLRQKHRGVIARYAKGRDYHDVIKGRLKHVAAALVKAHANDVDVKVFVDTAPLMEKPLAEAAGIGWQGKHTNLVSRTFGSWLLLGAIATRAELQPDDPSPDHCGGCRACLDVCPTDAFPAPYQLDARRCISYLTIEHPGHIARQFRTPIGNRIFGCDDCLAVCPWNKFATKARETKFHAREETDDPPLAELLALDDTAFRKRFATTPIKRLGRDRFIRNTLIAAGNSASRDYLTQIKTHLTDGSSLVRAMAVWALGEIADPSEIDALKNARVDRENDSIVRTEWRHATEKATEAT